jgi:hypothetical protein
VNKNSINVDDTLWYERDDNDHRVLHSGWVRVIDRNSDYATVEYTDREKYPYAFYPNYSNLYLFEPGTETETENEDNVTKPSILTEPTVKPRIHRIKDIRDLANKQNQPISLALATDIDNYYSAGLK